VALTSGGSSKSDPAWSPNGRYIVYTVTTTGHTTSTQTWIMDANGTNPKLVTSAGSYDAEATWAPNGDQLAFVSDQSGAKYIWLAAGLTTPAAPTSWGRIKGLYRE